ncbi:unnamed protein product [Moneuplotes crassus]|uniref:Uncharacterized protein n=1 Tax=Euplotes crassus TaxID=5936 RepID=A0AAD1UA09_EUPCR|nr:unnamed protein product [Moneuplotes crassus]
MFARCHKFSHEPALTGRITDHSDETMLDSSRNSLIDNNPNGLIISSFDSAKFHRRIKRSVVNSLTNSISDASHNILPKTGRKKKRYCIHNSQSSPESGFKEDLSIIGRSKLKLLQKSTKIPKSIKLHKRKDSRFLKDILNPYKDFTAADIEVVGRSKTKSQGRTSQSFDSCIFGLKHNRKDKHLPDGCIQVVSDKGTAKFADSHKYKHSPLRDHLQNNKITEIILNKDNNINLLVKPVQLSKPYKNRCTLNKNISKIRGLQAINNGNRGLHPRPISKKIKKAFQRKLQSEKKQKLLVLDRFLEPTPEIPKSKSYQTTPPVKPILDRIKHPIYTKFQNKVILSRLESINLSFPKESNKTCHNSFKATPNRTGKQYHVKFQPNIKTPLHPFSQDSSQTKLKSYKFFFKARQASRLPHEL